jgi:RNA polymerase sigma-70 factor (ECF subfamily)
VTSFPRYRPLLGEAAVPGPPSVVRAFFDDGAEDRAAEVEASPSCDRTALAAVYGELAPRVHRFLRDLLGDGTLASDATQETFVRAFRKVDGLPRSTRLIPWVFGVARFVAFELRKARGRGRRVIDDAQEVADHAPDVRGRSPEQELLDREAVTVVERAQLRQSEEPRTVLLLRCDHGLAYEDIAPLMGWSLAKVKIEIFRAREVLRATLEQYRRGEGEVP